MSTGLGFYPFLSMDIMDLVVRTSQGGFRLNPQQSYHDFSQGITAFGEINTKIPQEGTSGRLFIMCQEDSKAPLHGGYGQAPLLCFTSPAGNHAGVFIYS